MLCILPYQLLAFCNIGGHMAICLYLRAHENDEDKNDISPSARQVVLLSAHKGKKIADEIM